MKRKAFFAVKAAGVLLLAMLFLLGGFSLIPPMTDGTRTFSVEGYAPEISMPEAEISESPASQVQLEGRFGVYTFVSYDDGKSVATIYSKEQIRDFNLSRKQGQWFSVTADEVLFLLNDTMELLATYDVVKVRGLDYSVTTFFGDGLYASRELDTGKRHGEILSLLFARLKVINTPTYDSDEDIWAVYTDTGENGVCEVTPPYLLTVENLKNFPHSDEHYTQKELQKYPPYGVFVALKNQNWAKDPCLYYSKDIRNPILLHMREVYPEPLLPN